MTIRHVLALDIGSNSVGSAWLDLTATSPLPLLVGTSIFPAGVDEADDKRGEPKNAKRRMVRRTRITLARRAQRKRELRLKLIEVGLLPPTAEEFQLLLEKTDPWELRKRGLDAALTPHEFGRVLLHLSQRRGALGLKLPDPEAGDDAGGEDGKVKAAISDVRAKMQATGAQTFGQFIAMERAKRVHAITTEDRRPEADRKGRREYRDPVRNKGGSYEHCADRGMIRKEFSQLWEIQLKLASWSAQVLTPQLRLELDDESGDSTWKHQGLLFGQRRQTWDLGTLGRCVLEPSERCVPIADRHASHFRVIETVNNIKVLEKFSGPRPLTIEEREKIIDLLRGPLGLQEKGKFKGYPKRSCSVTDIREALGLGRGGKDKWPKLNLEADESREINTDWFHREIVHGAIGIGAWATIPESLREGFNRAILRHNPEEEGDAEKLKAGVMTWGKLDVDQAERLIRAWKTRPNLEKRLSMSRKATRNILALMDRRDPQGTPLPWAVDGDASSPRWITQIEARKQIAEDAEFRDVSTGDILNTHAQRRYATGAKGLTARDRHYLKRHPHDLPPAPMLSNPVVRKAIHEVRRHIVEYMQVFNQKPDEIYIELAREARMGAKDADRLLMRNRLRDRIRKDILREYNLESTSVNQQRAAVDRVVLAVQQGSRCPLCGKAGLTSRSAALGTDCELAHILPRSRGGHNGHGNMVLAHLSCNRDMKNQTPREFWSARRGGFEEGMQVIESIYGDVKRAKFSEIKSAQGESLWNCYFDFRDDARKIEQFAKDIKDEQGMTNRQDAATKYAARQIMAYLSDALYEGRGLPERASGQGREDDRRRIFTTDGLWTSRLRREWGLFFDPHDAKAKGIDAQQEQEAQEKNRGDHRHHAIDAVVIGLTTESIKRAWDEREKKAEAAIRYEIGLAPEEQIENYRRAHPLPPPAPFSNREDLREHVKLAVFGDKNDRSGFKRPIAHRPVKRKLIGALHEESLFGPVLDQDGNLTGNYTAKKSILALDCNHLRTPRPETRDEAIKRLADARLASTSAEIKPKEAKAWAQSMIDSKGYCPILVDPAPGKSGIVRDIALRRTIRLCLEQANIDPDDFTSNQIKKLVTDQNGAIRGLRAPSGVPIKSFVLLRSMSDPVVIARKAPDYITGEMLLDPDPASQRAYVGGNNHHIEYRAREVKKGSVTLVEWTGHIVSAFEAAQRKLAKLRAFKAAGVPKPDVFRDANLPKAERSKLRQRWNPIIRAIEAQHPIVDHRDNDELGGEFIMSLAEGEMVRMLSKSDGESKGKPGYFVVAKLDKPRSVVLVPHWDARAAGLRKGSDDKPVPNSAREQFAATPTDLLKLACEGDPHAVKVRVSALGKVTVLERD
jgi:CRISPR-associated endonuclease Csn1